jgi:hypothetical protein
MTQQMGRHVTAFHPIVTLLRPYTLGFTDFKAVLLLQHRNKKYEVVHILAYLPPLDAAVRSNGKSNSVFENSTAIYLRS